MNGYGRWFWVGVFLCGTAALGACSDDGGEPQGAAGAGQGGGASTQGGADSTSAGSATKPVGGGGSSPTSGGVATGGHAATGGDAGAAGEGGGGGGEAGAGGNPVTGGAAGVGGADNGGSSAAGDGAAGAGANGELGLCDAPDPIVPTLLPSCNLTSDEPTCRGCLKTKACAEWQGCYGNQPRSACGYGAHIEDDGQFDCIVFCFADGGSGSLSPDDLVVACANSCENQCAALNEDTYALLHVAFEKCTEECFPF